MAPLEHLRFLEQIANLYEAGIAAFNPGVKNDVEQDSWQALACFLYGYAYERQGASPAYAPAAKRTITEVVNQDASWDDAELTHRIWRLYKEQLGDLPLNEQDNPMCPKGTRYRTKSGKQVTSQPSAIEFVQQYASKTSHNIALWAGKVLSIGGLRQGHILMTSINGVGAKIASLFLRDVALVYGIEPQKSRELLQPIDVWVKRYVYRWAGKMSDAKCAKWIVENCRLAGTSPEKVNAGMWYFGALIAGDERTLMRLLEEGVASVKKETEAYVSRLAVQVQRWHQLTN
jgi:hypothetical protein